MKKFEGKSEVFSYYDAYHNRFKYAFDRKIFSNRQLYPGDTWKRAHFILFGYYPKDWDDMCTYTSNYDDRCHTSYYPHYKSDDELEVSLYANYKDTAKFEWDDYDAMYETIKFLMEQEPVFDDCIHKHLYNHKAFSRYGLNDICLNSLISDINYIQENEWEFKDEEEVMRLTKKPKMIQNDVIGNAMKIISYYVFNKAVYNEKKKEGEFTKYLNIDSEIYSDEVIKAVTEAFNKAVIPAYKNASSQSKELFEAVQNAIKKGNFELVDVTQGKGNEFKFILKNDDIAFVFGKNSVGVQLNDNNQLQ